MQPVTLPPGLQSDLVDATTGSSGPRTPLPRPGASPTSAAPPSEHRPGQQTTHGPAHSGASGPAIAPDSAPSHSHGPAHSHGRDDAPSHEHDDAPSRGPGPAHDPSHSHSHDHATERRMRRFADFALIRERGVEVAHWHRPHAATPSVPLPADEQQWKGRATDALADPTLPLGILPDAASRDLLLADLHDMTASFLAIAEGFRVQASLSVVHGVQCPKWHVDSVAFRLTCTFRGPGTEWVCGDHADRNMLGRASDCLVTANRRIVPDGVHVHRAGPGDIVLLKGRSLGPEEAGAIHRSPEVDASTGPRLVWTLTAWRT